MTPAYPVLDRRSLGSRLLDRLDRDPSGLLARSLSPFGAVYAAAARWGGDDPLPPEPPCVGVGNLRVGGTGKTPVVGQLVQRLRERGLRVGVLSRGYRADGGGDEPAWLRKLGAKVELDPDRRRGRERLLREGVDVLLMDDALQTRWRPHHCLGLGLFRDRGRPPRCLPAGPAREGASAARARAELWAWRHDGGFPEGSAPAGELHFRLEPNGLLDLGTGTERELSTIGGRSAVALSGLARPGSFEEDLLAVGVPLAGALRFEDHWNPPPGAAEEIRSFVRREGADLILCPEKNAARLARLDLGSEILAVRSTVRWWGDEAFARMASWFGI